MTHSRLYRPLFMMLIAEKAEPSKSDDFQVNLPNSFQYFERSWSLASDKGPYKVQYATCNVHHLRDLLFIFERYQQLWAAQLATLLLEIKQTVETAQQTGLTTLTPAQLATFEQRYLTLLDQGDADNPPATERLQTRGKLKQSPARNLLDRLRNSTFSLILSN